jgi:hypothetical protein
MEERLLRLARSAGLVERVSDESPKSEVAEKVVEFALFVGDCFSSSSRRREVCENCCRCRDWSPDLTIAGASALPESAERASTRLAAVLLIVLFVDCDRQCLVRRLDEYYSTTV